MIVRYLCLVFAMVVSVPVVGCNAQTAQAIVEFLPTIVRYIQDAQLILDQIDREVPPLLDRVGQPGLAEEYDKRMRQARAALLVAVRSTKGSQAISQGDIDAAFEEFRTAYRELNNLLQASGVLLGNTLSSKGGVAIEIPEPLAVQRPEQ
jgi:hypothetical protein